MTAIRSDAVEEISDIEEQKRELAAGFAALALAKATFDAEKRAFADQAAALAGLSVEWDRIEKLRADQLEEPLSAPPGTDPNKEPEPLLELEGDNIAGTSSGDPSDPQNKEDQGPHGEFLRLKSPVTAYQTEFPHGELPVPPVVQQPIVAGLDDKGIQAREGGQPWRLNSNTLTPAVNSKPITTRPFDGLERASPQPTLGQTVKRLSARDAAATEAHFSPSEP